MTRQQRQAQSRRTRRPQGRRIGRAPSRQTLLQLGTLLLAGAALAVFLLSQRVSSTTTYGGGPSRPLVPPEPPAVTLPTADQLVAALDARPVVRLPGATARWDTAAVERAIGDADIRILVTPGGLTKEQQRTLVTLDEAWADRTTASPTRSTTGTPTTGSDERPAREFIVVQGTRVSGDPGVALADDLPTWRDEFAAQDVTTQILTLVDAIRDAPQQPDRARIALRTPTSAELAPVLAAVRADRRSVAAGAELDGLPDALDAAFPGGRAVIAVFPAVTTGDSRPDWGAALSEALPDTPVVTVVGRWVDYHGPDAASFADITGASFYGQYREILGRDAVSTDGLVNAWLGRVVELRYSGIFGRPLPYQPVDPLAVTLPALPVVFVLCGAAFVFVTLRRLRRPRTDLRSDRARLAGLSGLLVEVSGLVGRDGAASLARASAALAAAQQALDDPDTAGRASARLDEAQRELDATARRLRRPEYRPTSFLAELAR